MRYTNVCVHSLNGFQNQSNLQSVQSRLLHKLHEVLLFQFLQVGVLANQPAFLGQLAQRRHRHVSIIQMQRFLLVLVSDFLFKCGFALALVLVFLVMVLILSLIIGRR